VFSSLFVARALATAALAAGLGVVLVRTRRTQVAVARLATDLGDAPPPGSLGQALARASGDPTLEVVYPLASGHVDASGRSVAAPAVGGGRAVTPIVRGGREVALVVHDAASVDAGQLRHEIGAAARLAVENERLQAELLAQLSDLRASRARVVEAGDAERQRLERNLHDGAQQRLLALLYDLRLARAEAESLDAPELTTLLGLATDETKAAIADLRDLAHGIYPAVLTEGGLGPAMWTLAEGAPIPVILGETPEERFTEAVERTAYAVAAEAVEAAGRSGSSQVAVRVVREDDRLIVEVEGAVGVFVHLADRVGAVGGELTHESGRLRAEIPCG
jgi:signal transduction histidine kinase